MYPSHEAQTRPQSPSTIDTPPDHQNAAGRITVQSVCAALKISKDTYNMLMESYFANMTAFSLFRPGSIEPKFAMMQHISEAETLVAAMFSFAARHCRDDAAQPGSCPSPSQFAQIAFSRYDETVERYGDLRPPFWLLQASVLITFYQLTQSVRSRSWRRLGDCIRSSYEMNLHLVDANHDPKTKTDKTPGDIQRWVLLEERRRAWWAVWEMDVFASTIRRLPTAINASVNLTMLPVSDSYWFNDRYQESCFLTEDCSLRWKHLTESGNESAKAWFIVTNSLMRNTQRIVYPAGSAMRILNDRFSETHQDQLNIVANSLYCTTASLPSRLAYQGETLDFRPRPAPQSHLSPRQEHADKYSIHLLTQLCRFMIYHHKICAQAPWLQSAKEDPSRESGTHAEQGQPTAAATPEWSNYMSASDEIVAVVRNSARDHYKYVNPFLANTLWFASAAQCACKVFGPSSFNKRLVTSNLDLLKLTIDRYISFWGGMESLKGRLSRIETGLQSLMTSGQAQATREGDAQRENLASRNGGTAGAAAGGSTGLDIPVDPGILPPNGATSGTPQPLLGMPGVGMNGWNDQRWTSFQDFGDFTPQFSMADQNFYPTDPLDFSPFGMEELLVMNMDPNLGGN
ncbi:fungal-specific transcription factor domain-containing protein [Cercophora newfieldiana]|uniref:Fungal-specific transcription factor domain-containing protein n=1 Tax=Cercophora newfieldiana TaxID=92897 RepID=A0AA39YSN1_9PEZI|nr:fungal-specific transcription factor domain-containing protein [Cercophora newfieldiana]